MSEQDGRSLLGKAQVALQRGDLERARAAFEAAATRFSGPAELLGGGHAWRGVAQVAATQGDHAEVERALALAERVYQLGRELLPDPGEGLGLDLLEGCATCGAMRADLALRRGRLTEARHAIDAVYPLYRGLGDRPSVANLWMTTARLAEREGRWFSARTAWAQVMRVRKANRDEAGQCDALIRMAEALLAEDDVDKARARLDEAALLARSLEDSALLGRVEVGYAKALEQQHDWDGAWEKWLDAMHALRESDPLLRGLSQVRMARSAVRVRPAEAGELLEKGLVALLEARYGDAIGLVLHQLAVVSLVRGDGRTALVAAVGADRARGGDDALKGLIVRALMRLGDHRTAWLVSVQRRLTRDDAELESTIELLAERLGGPPPVDPADAAAVERTARAALDAVVAPIARSRGLPLDEVGSRRAAMTLVGSATEPGAVERVAAPVVASLAERPVLVWEIQEGAQEQFVLPEGITLLGRGADNGVRMGWDGLASRTHCAIAFDGTELRVRDMRSQHGTFLGAHRVEGEEPWPRGVPLRVGDTEFAIEWRSSVGASIRMPASASIAVRA